MEEIRVDFLAILGSLWRARRRCLMGAGVGALFGLVIALSQPPSYTVSVSLLAEQGSEGISSGMSSMASLMGLGSMAQGTESLSAALYPKLTESTPYLLELSKVELPGHGTVGEYLLSERKPWWGYLMELPGKVTGLLSGGDKGDIRTEGLTPRDIRLARRVGGVLSSKYEAKSRILSLSATAGDPAVAAAMTDSARVLLQRYVTRYHTSKAEMDMREAERLYEDRKEAYYERQQAYAAYADQNQSTVGLSRSVTARRLQEEATLAYQVYTQVAGQLEVARAKLQQAKPVFTIVEPAYVPSSPTSPRKMRLIVGFGLLGWFLVMAYVVTAPGIKECLRLIKQS